MDSCSGKDSILVTAAGPILLASNDWSSGVTYWRPRLGVRICDSGSSRDGGRVCGMFDKVDLLLSIFVPEINSNDKERNIDLTVRSQHSHGGYS